MFEIYLGDEIEVKKFDSMVANSARVTQIQILGLDPEWEGLSMYAQWRSFGDPTATWVPIEGTFDSVFEVPNSVLGVCGSVIYMSIYGKDLENHVVKITPWCYIGVVQSGADPGPENPDDPPLPDDHRALSHREDADQHPIEAITGLHERFIEIRDKFAKMKAEMPIAMSAEELQGILAVSEVEARRYYLPRKAFGKEVNKVEIIQQDKREEG